jgi:hypothetical protein
MGRRRRENDDRAHVLLEAQDNARQDRRAACLQRWPGILAAIRVLLAAYNDGAGEELLTATEQSGDDPTVTITSRGSANGGITVSIDGDALLVRSNPASDAAAALHRIARRIDCSRSDPGTAAYLLQDWMDQL